MQLGGGAAVAESRAWGWALRRPWLRGVQPWEWGRPAQGGSQLLHTRHVTRHTTRLQCWVSRSVQTQDRLTRVHYQV